MIPLSCILCVVMLAGSGCVAPATDTEAHAPVHPDFVVLDALSLRDCTGFIANLRGDAAAVNAVLPPNLTIVSQTGALAILRLSGLSCAHAHRGTWEGQDVELALLSVLIEPPAAATGQDSDRRPYHVLWAGGSDPRLAPSGTPFESAKVLDMPLLALTAPGATTWTIETGDGTMSLTTTGRTDADTTADRLAFWPSDTTSTRVDTHAHEGDLEPQTLRLTGTAPLTPFLHGDVTPADVYPVADYNEQSESQP